MPSIAAVSSLLLALSLAPGVLALAQAQDQDTDSASFWSFLKPGTVVERCVEGSKENDAAREAAYRLGEKITALTASSDTAPALAALRDLLRMPCFHLASEEGEPPMPAHPLALKTWWDEGGDLWIWSYVKEPQEGLPPDMHPVVRLPPSPQRVLSKETVAAAAAADNAGDDEDEKREAALAASNVAPILCSQTDDACGVETQGWMERARAALRAKPVEFPRSRVVTSKPSPADPLASEDPNPTVTVACAKAGAGLPPGKAYTTWRSCVASHRPSTRALPLGRTRAPREGWLILEGRRGHYNFCDELRAYDLETGAAYVLQSCSGLALQSDGSVDTHRTNAQREASVRGGRVAVDNLREALWMMLLKSQAYDSHLELDSYPIPAGMSVRYHVGGLEEEGEFFGAGRGWSTAWTRLDWRWIRDDGSEITHGTQTWPTSDDPADAHAASLLAIAEHGLVSGCPSRALPPLESFIKSQESDSDIDAYRSLRAQLLDRDRVKSTLCSRNPR